MAGKNGREAKIAQLESGLRKKGWTIAESQDTGALVIILLEAKGCTEQILEGSLAQLPRMVKEFPEAQADDFAPIVEYDVLEPEVSKEVEPSLSEEDLIWLEQAFHNGLVTEEEYAVAIASGELPERGPGLLVLFCEHCGHQTALLHSCEAEIDLDIAHQAKIDDGAFDEVLLYAIASHESDHNWMESHDLNPAEAEAFGLLEGEGLWDAEEQALADALEAEWRKTDTGYPEEAADIAYNEPGWASQGWDKDSVLAMCWEARQSAARAKLEEEALNQAHAEMLYGEALDFAYHAGFESVDEASTFLVPFLFAPELHLVNGFSDYELGAAWAKFNLYWNMLDAPNEYDKVYHKQVVEIPQNKEVIEMLFAPTDRPSLVSTMPTGPLPMPEKIPLGKVLNPRLVRAVWHSTHWEFVYINLARTELVTVSVDEDKLDFTWEEFLKSVKAMGFTTWGCGNGYVSSALAENTSKIEAFERERAATSFQKALGATAEAAITAAQDEPQQPKEEGRGPIIWIIITPGHKTTLCKNDKRPHTSQLGNRYGPKLAAKWLLQHGWRVVSEAKNTIQLVPPVVS